MLHSLKPLLDPLLDASIVFSFDRSGFERHARSFDPSDLQVDLRGRRVLVTGANAGLGRVATLHLALLGAEVWMLCRSRDRGEQALEDLRFASGSDSLHLELVDLSHRGSVRDFADRFGDRPIDVLIHNAGILPSERVLVDDGETPRLESTWATNVVGQFLLTWRLTPNLIAASASDGAHRARVIVVTSGGMYTQRLDLSNVSWAGRSFDGVVAYAQTKRAEMVLTEQWARRLGPRGVDVMAMHPGWADTGGVRDGLPGFHRVMGDRLRDARQGADTIVWLAAAEAVSGRGGELFFDRRPVPTHLLPGTRASAATRRRLWQLCLEHADLAGAPRPWTQPPTASPSTASPSTETGEPDDFDDR